MMEQGNLPTQRVNISTQKMLGGIGSILIAIGWVSSWVPGTGDLLGIAGLAGPILWLVSLYQLSNMLKKSDIFRKALIGFILQIVGFVISYSLIWEALREVPEAALYSLRGDEIGNLLGAIISTMAVIFAYPFNVISSYFYKRACDILSLATAQNLFKTAGLLIFIGAITTLFVLGLLLIFVGYIVLAAAFFTAPNEVEVKGT